MKARFKITGLDCANCGAELERKIQKIEEIESVSLNFIMQKMEIEYSKIEKEELINKIKKVIKKEETDVTIEEI